MAKTQFRDGKISIPDDIREAAHLRDGEELEAEITAAGIRESHVHDVQITKEAPNYRAD